MAPSNPSSPPSKPQYDFQPPARTFRRPRAWERAPSSPFAAHPPGRKVWKRVPARTAPDETAGPHDRTEEEEERAVKRLRVKVSIQCADQGRLRGGDRYITTLHDKAAATPKRKFAKRKTLKPGRFGKEGDRRSSPSQEATTEVDQAIGTVTDCQNTTTRSHAIVTEQDDQSTPTKTETSQATVANQDNQSTTTNTGTGQAIVAEEDQSTTKQDESTTANAESGHDDQILATSLFELQFPGSPVELTSTGNDPLTKLSTNSSFLEMKNERVETNVCNQPASETSVTDCLENETTSNEAETKEISEQIEQPGRSTRPAPRFSDDTNLLKDFLNRAQAKKAARNDQSDGVLARNTHSRLSPRAALADVTRSPPQSSDFANHHGTPTGKQMLVAVVCQDEEEEEEEEAQEEDSDQVALEATSCRRSTRKRLFTPAKTPVITRIPVRRADGAEPIVLRRSEAQELATVTRKNTRKNKGQSKPPKLTLKQLPADAADEIIVGPSGREDSRAVGWDKTLVYYLDQSEPKEGEEKRARVRRLRKLGAVNGTPAPKKLLAEMESSNEGLAPKGRGKSKGRVAK